MKIPPTSPTQISYFVNKVKKGLIGIGGSHDPRETLYINGSKISIEIKAPVAFLEIKCTDECGNISQWFNDLFEMNIIGMLQFRCKKCGNIINVPDVLFETKVI